MVHFFQKNRYVIEHSFHCAIFLSPLCGNLRDSFLFLRRKNICRHSILKVIIDNWEPQWKRSTCPWKLTFCFRHTSRISFHNGCSCGMWAFCTNVNVIGITITLEDARCWIWSRNPVFFEIWDVSFFNRKLQQLKTKTWITVLILKNVYICSCIFSIKRLLQSFV